MLRYSFLQLICCCSEKVKIGQRYSIRALCDITKGHDTVSLWKVNAVFDIPNTKEKHNVIGKQKQHTNGHISLFKHARAHTHPHTPKHPYLHVDSGPFLSDLHHTGEETRRKTKTPPGSWPTSSDSPLTVMSRLTWKWVLVDAVQETTCYTSQSDSFLCGSEMLRSLNRSGWITHVLGFLTFNSITLLSGKQISLRRRSQLSFFIITFFS